MMIKDLNTVQRWRDVIVKRPALPGLPLKNSKQNRRSITLVIALISICMMLAGITARKVQAKNTQPIEWLKLKVGDLRLPAQIGSLTTEHEPILLDIARPQFIGVVSEVSVSYYHTESRTKASIRIIMPFNKATVGWGKKYFHYKKEERLKIAGSDRYRVLEAYDGGDSFATEYAYLNAPKNKWRSRHLGNLVGEFAYLIDAEGDEGKVDHALSEAETAATMALGILKKALGGSNPGATQIGNYNLTLGELGFPAIAGEWSFADIVFAKTNHQYIDKVQVTYENSWAKGTLNVNLFFPNDWGTIREGKRQDIRQTFAKFQKKVIKRIQTRSVEMIRENPGSGYDSYEFEYLYEPTDNGKRRVVERGKLKTTGSFHLDSEIREGTAVSGTDTLAAAAHEALHRIVKAKTSPPKSIYQNAISEESKSGNPNSRQPFPGQRERWQSVVE